MFDNICVVNLHCSIYNSSSIFSSLLSIVFPFPVLSTFEQHQHHCDHSNTSKTITNPQQKENQLVLCAMSELHTVENKISQVVK